jgi:hypothetical protein
MNAREKLLGIGKLHLMRGEPIPLDILVQADELGLSIEDFGEPVVTTYDYEGEN